MKNWLFLSLFFYNPDQNTESLLSDFLKILPDLSKGMNVVIFVNPSLDWYLRPRLNPEVADLRLLYKNISQFDIESHLDIYRENYANELPNYWLFLNLDNEKFPLFMSLAPDVARLQFNISTKGDLFIFHGENYDSLLYDHLGNFSQLVEEREAEIVHYFHLEEPDFLFTFNLLLDLPFDIEGNTKRDTIIKCYYSLLRSNGDKLYLIDKILSSLYYIEEKEKYAEILHETLKIFIMTYASSEEFRDSVSHVDMDRYRENLSFYRNMLSDGDSSLFIDVDDLDDLDRLIKGKMMKFFSPELLSQAEFFYPFHFFSIMENTAVLVKKIPVERDESSQ